VTRILSLLSLLVLTPFFALADVPSQHGGTIQMTFDLSHQPAGATRLWLPLPQSDPLQKIDNLSYNGDYAKVAVNHDSKENNRILYVSWPATAKERHLSLSFEVTRQRVDRPTFPEQEATWLPADFGESLGATALGPVDGEVKALATRITAGKTQVLDKVRAIYDWVCDTMYRDPETRGCGKGDVCSLLQRPGGKCTDISSVFIALCRAASVPAREVFGLRLGKTGKTDVSGWQHCWSEFFLPGVGWVAADPADVLKKQLVEKLDKNDPQLRQAREFFFGGLDPYRFRLAGGRDLQLIPSQQRGVLNTFGYPYAEIDGVALDFYAPKEFSYQYQYTPR